MEYICSGFLFLLFLFSLPSAIGGIGDLIVAWQQDQEARKKAEAEEKLKRENPELWRQQELLKLEKERLETQRQLAQEQAQRESTRQNVGMGIAIGRYLGWW